MVSPDPSAIRWPLEVRILSLNFVTESPRTILDLEWVLSQEKEQRQDGS